MIKISHESPLSMLEISRTYNDYDYALVHLFETNPVYYNFFKDSLKQGRTVLLDNSIFELGTAYDSNKYIDWINKLEPTEYIIPDALEECNKTIWQAENWMKNTAYHVHTRSMRIGVVQGTTYGELVKCYTALDRMGIDKLAISFDYSYYLTVFPHPNKWVSYAMGRVMALNQLLDDGIINTKKPHHLLGCAHPREFSFYNSSDFNWIESLDTSSPIVHGIKKVGYGDLFANWTKEKTKLVDLLDSVPDAEQEKWIARNLETFKKFVHNG
jgi:hypothetical protein